MDEQKGVKRQEMKHSLSSFHLGGYRLSCSLYVDTCQECLADQQKLLAIRSWEMPSHNIIMKAYAELQPMPLWGSHNFLMQLNVEFASMVYNRLSYYDHLQEQR